MSATNCSNRITTDDDANADQDENLQHLPGTQTNNNINNNNTCQKKHNCSQSTKSLHVDDWSKDDTDNFDKTSDDSEELLLNPPVLSQYQHNIQMQQRSHASAIFDVLIKRNNLKTQSKFKLIGNIEVSIDWLVSILFTIIIFLLITAVVLLTVVIILSARIRSALLNSSTNSTLTNFGSLNFNEDLIYNSFVYQDLKQKESISNALLNSFLPKNVRDNIRWLSNDVHVAGTSENNEIMNRISHWYKNYGYNVKSYEYTVLLNYPNYEFPNMIYWRNNNNNWTVISNGKSEKKGTGEAAAQQNDPRSLIYWTAYSKNGTAEGELVYANYCTEDDLDYLFQAEIKLNGKIVLCRYGKLFRGQLVFLAEKRGAAGVILYSDPDDYARGRNIKETFPHQIWLPDSGAQRGTLLRTEGDPETPLFPSKDYIYRTETETSVRASGIMPNIPVMPIGYRDALKLMQKLDGTQVQFQWQGGMNVTYRYTGSAIFRLSVRSTTTRRKIKNVVGMLRGAIEPDRYILLSNHVDAWVQGAIDPATGTATMLEMARVLTNVIREQKWRPRRSIVFCHWDAEEYGLIGSTEWVEELMKPLQQRAVALINVDNINGNTTLLVKAVPLLYRALVDAASKIPTPNKAERNAGRKTILDSWKYHAPGGTISGDRSIPRITVPGSGSDYQRFLTYLGIPVADIRFESVPLYSYMLYHSMYEIPWTVENLIDRDFAATTAVGQLWLELGRSLADSLVIPFSPHDYAVIIAEHIDKLHLHLLNLNIAQDFGINEYHKVFQNLHDAAKRFRKVADYAQNFIYRVNSNHTLLTRKQLEMLNNRLQNLERAFIFEHGIYSTRQHFRHVIFSNSISNKYRGILLAGILEPAEKWKSAAEKDDVIGAKQWLRVCQIGFNKLQYAIESAILILNLDGFRA